MSNEPDKMDTDNSAGDVPTDTIPSREDGNTMVDGTIRCNNGGAGTSISDQGGANGDAASSDDSNTKGTSSSGTGSSGKMTPSRPVPDNPSSIIDDHETGTGTVHDDGSERHDDARVMTRPGYYGRVAIATVLTVMAVLLSIAFILMSVSMWYYHAWNVMVESLIILVVLLFTAGVLWVYISGLLHLRRDIANGSIIIRS